MCVLAGHQKLWRAILKQHFQTFLYSKCYTYALCVTNDFSLLLLHMRAPAARMCLSGTAEHGNPNRAVLETPRAARLRKTVLAVTGTPGIVWRVLKLPSPHLSWTMPIFTISTITLLLILSQYLICLNLLEVSHRKGTFLISPSEIHTTSTPFSLIW